jgi:hypothetical protein
MDLRPADTFPSDKVVLSARLAQDIAENGLNHDTISHILNALAQVDSSMGRFYNNQPAYLFFSVP